MFTVIAMSGAPLIDCCLWCPEEDIYAYKSIRIRGSGLISFRSLACGILSILSIRTNLADSSYSASVGSMEEECSCTMSPA